MVSSVQEFRRLTYRALPLAPEFRNTIVTHRFSFFLVILDHVRVVNYNYFYVIYSTLPLINIYGVTGVTSKMNRCDPYDALESTRENIKQRQNKLISLLFTIGN